MNPDILNNSSESIVRPELSQFASKRASWIECFNAGDRNSITQQIIHLIWNATAFRTINEARRLAEPSSRGRVMVNPMLYNLLDECFWTSQILGVRKLVDKNALTSGNGNSDKSVYSLISLINDMQSNLAYFTRENMLRAEGIPYDASDAVAKELALCREARASGAESYWGVPRDADPEITYRRHNDIDQLTATPIDMRRPDDRIGVQVFSNLCTKVKDATKKFEVLANKYSAHASSASSRTEVSPEDIVISLQVLTDAHVSICRTAQFIGQRLLGVGENVFLAQPRGDQFAYIDRPLVTGDNLNVIRKYWDDEKTKIENWGVWSMEDIVGS